MNIQHTLLFIALAALLSSCEVGPNYRRPSAPVPTHFKEADGWKPATPSQPASGTRWWTVYQDPVLDELEKQVDVSNQTLKQYVAAWQEAVDVAKVAGTTLFPTVSLSGSGTRTQSASSAAANGTGNEVTGVRRAPPFNYFSVAGGVSWEPDIWGKIRRTIESDVASAKASEADLAAARLSAQGTLAIDYMELRVVDEEKTLYDQTIQGYQRSLQITQNQYNSGIVPQADVITAETQLQGAQSQQIALGVERAQLEHAIAVLIGKPPAEFSLRPAKLADAIPVVPAGVPSSLLERRPDIAAAERQMAAANALIGVAIAAYFPSLTLSGSDGFASTLIDQLIKSPSNAWSFGGNLSETLFDFGARKYTVQEYRAAYDAAVASYRETVLTAFQQVEDELAALRILQQEYTVADETVQKANKVVELTLNEYKAGTVAYTSVVTVQITALSDALTLASIRSSRLVASVSLIEYLGGGWTVHELK
jgi:NodT family efflux transporter outer membrane factor (OMF) lipoprotein